MSPIVSLLPLSLALALLPLAVPLRTAHPPAGAFATRLARDCARNPVALERLTDDRAAKAVT